MAYVYFKCRCGKSLAVDENGMGGMVNCPNCGYQFMIPAPVLQWACPNCGASMLAPGEMCGETVQCLTCQSEVQAPDRGDQEDMAPAESPVPSEAPGSEDLSSHLNKMFIDCSQCHERLPIKTLQCPHCGHVFSRQNLRSVVMGMLGVVILAGIGLGLWQAGFWPFSSGKQAPPAPLAPAVPSPSVMVLPRSASNAVVAAAVPTGKTEMVSLAIPAPAVVPSDTNAVSVEEWRVRFEMSRRVITALMDKAYPRGELNRNVELRQLDGLMIHGTNAGVGATNITLVVDGKPQAIAFQSLDAYAWLKVDMEFRSTWIDAQTAALVRRSLVQEGKKLTGLSTNSEEALDQMLSLGDSRAQYQAAEQFYKQKDFPYALLYFRASAAQDHAVAQYALGVMYYQGIGVGSDRKEGLTWLALAAAQGHVKAEQFIQQHKISQEVRQKLLKQEQARKEKTGREYEAALKAYQNQSQTPAPAPAQPAGSLKGSAKLDSRIYFRDGIGERQYYYQQGKRVYE
ncbi:MAG: SEL1-like repeat protein [Verrucomicrobia bacterium]|nr:SEL1-like repeat protein [Verrucomicrobiota bacterium]MCG2679735.1 hypothetical protein [Kiritimatiellia bacterium]MBU4248573.1 SEL1-like repeat protein [Verrucomicrobiota bacterium]MBU4291547.1 SEL1-like repeat protein [Verrucomicrobiota bacterium]MBU4428899.1 SEL1-like repeat protein [Verrucomicrobiota bacterium]